MRKFFSIKKTAGFTLIELMIVVVIVSLLAMIAYPSYRNYVLRSHRADALATLAQDQATIERCYAQNFSYNAACASLPTFPHNSPQNYYSISISNLTASTYTLTATAIGSQAIDTTCSTYTIDQANQRNATDSSGTPQSSCWAL